MLKQTLVLVCLLVAAFSARSADFTKDVKQDDSYCFVGQNEHGDYLLQLYYHFPNIQSVDDRVTLFVIPKDKYPLKEGQEIINVVDKDNFMKAVYLNGKLNIDNQYRRKSNGKKYKARSVLLTYTVTIGADLNNQTVGQVNGTYSHVPAN